MKLVVGLGNPGEKYSGTRHNVGFDVLWELFKRWGADRPKSRFEGEVSEAVVGFEKVLLVWPLTYMNLSGKCVAPLAKYHQLETSDLLVICDDLNLKLGQLRMRASGSAGGQKGLASIIQSLSTESVPRLRIGIDRPAPPMDAATYVLARFRKDELDSIDDAVRQAAIRVETWVKSGIDTAMNQTNGDATGNAKP